MKLALLYLFIFPCCLYAEDVLNGKQHQAFCVELKQLDAIDESITRYEKEVEERDATKVVIPPKSEFETTADFNKRVQSVEAANEQQRTKRNQELSESVEKLRQQTVAIMESVSRKQNELRELVISIKVTMGSYDADSATISSLKPELSVIGSYEGHAAVVKTGFGLPGELRCPAANARLMREASDKGELYCVARLKLPKILMSHEAVEVPLTTGDQVQQFVGKVALGLLMNAVDPNQTDAVINSVPNPTTKSLDAYVIRLDSAETLEYLRFMRGNTVLYGN